MILAKGDPTWWGEVQAWFTLNEEGIYFVIFLILVAIVVWPGKQRRG